jgi:hypothetical protein
MAKSTEVALKDTSSDLAAYEAFADHGDLGFENQGKEDYSLPFIAVLQPMSAVVNTEDSPYKAGMILNTVTGEAVKGGEGIRFIPVSTKHNYIEWIPKEKGGGIAGVHELDSDVVRAARDKQRIGKLILDNGNELVETFAVFGLVVDVDNIATQAVISFASTKIKKYKNWMTKARTIQIPIGGGRKVKAPLPSHIYRLKTVKQTSPKGDYFNWDIAFDGPDAASCRLAPNDPLFQEALALSQLVKEGLAKADHAKEAAATGGSQGTDEEIPF